MPLLISESWEVLRERFSREPMKGALEKLAANVKGRLSQPMTPEYAITPGEPNPPDNVGDLPNAVCDAALIHKVTGEPLDIQNCIRIIEGVLNRSSWMHPAHQHIYETTDEPRARTVTADLRSATLTYTFALMLDWLGDELPRELRLRMTEQLRWRGTDNTLSNIKRGAYWSDWYISNWCAQLMMGLAVGAAFEKHADPLSEKKLEEARTRSLRFLDAQGTDGGYHESIGYSWAIMILIFTSLALEHAGKPGLLEHPFLRSCGDFLVHSICPGFVGLANFSDATYSLHSLAWLGFLARSFERPDWQWAARNIFERTEIRSRWDVLWFDPDMPEESPSPKKRARLFTNTHFAFARNGWDNDARYLVVPAGSVHFGHRHADLGSFLLNEFGERQIADSGKFQYGLIDPWHVKSEAHSTLLVNGEGISWARSPLTRNSPDAFGDRYGLINEFQIGDETDVIIEDATKAYADHCDRFVRAFISLHEGPLVVMDDIRAKEEKAGAELELRFIATEDAEARGNTFTISHPKSECQGEVLLPAGVTLSLAEEKRESDYEPAPAKLIPIRVIHKLAEEKRDAHFVTLIWPHLKGARPNYEATATSEPGTFSCHITAEGARWDISMKDGKITVSTI
jgi:hypothetical protein